MAKRRRVACVTMARDEPLFLPIWFRHYAGEFGAENLFVLDHRSESSPGERGEHASPKDQVGIDPDADSDVFGAPAVLRLCHRASFL